MMPTPRAVGDTARAVLDGAPVDWVQLESTSDARTRALLGQLRLLSAVADVHRTDTDRERAEPGRPLAAAEGPDASSTTWGHLNLLEKVGEGAFGEVYRAWDTRLDREVALKLLPAGSARGKRSSPIVEEGRLLARVRHPNVATIYGAELVDDRIGLWMEFIHGRTLEDMLRSGYRFDPLEVVGIGIELCRAVSAVHAAGLLHRDIKAQNVMQADDGRVVLMDFGTGLDQSSGEAATAGTPLYLAPEVLRGGPATVRSEVYSIGVLLYHLLTGVYPFPGGTIADLRRAHQEGTLVDVRDARRDLPPALVHVIRRAMDADPEGRYDACDALADDLVTLTGRSNRRGLTVALVLLAGVSVIGWLAWDTARSGNDVRVAAVSAAPGIGDPAAAASDRTTIAVLPFRILSSKPESDLLAEGLTYELIRQLGLIEGIEVRSATSSFALADRGDPVSAARQLNAALLIEGNVLESEGRWRISVQMARVSDDGVIPLLTRTFDPPQAGMLSVLDDVSLAVVNNLRITIGHGQRRYDLDADTEDLYLKARALVERRGTPSASRAADLFEQVVARDATFAPGFAGLADAYAFMSTDLPQVGGLPPDQALELMRPAAERALALDPLLAEAHAAMGFVHSREFAWDEAEASFRRAIELNPGLTHAYTSFTVTTLKPLGRLAEAEALLLEALRRDPLSLTILRDLAEVRIEDGRYDEAIRDLQAVMAVDPDLPYVSLHLARALTFAGRIEEAMPIWDSRDELGWQHWKALAYVRAGRRAEVEAMLIRNTRPYWRAMIYAALGDTDEAVVALDEAALDVPQRVVWLVNYPEMEGLRVDPRFHAIRARFRLP